MAKKTNLEKASRHEARGDEWAGKGKHKRALGEYRKVLELDPDRAGLYDKLIATRDLIPGEWKEEDFAESLGWVMKKQEQEHPPIRQTHARLSPEWTKATTVAIQVITEEDEERRRASIEELVAMGEIATRAMIGLLLDLKKMPSQTGEKDDPPPHP